MTDVHHIKTIKTTNPDGSVVEVKFSVPEGATREERIRAGLKAMAKKIADDMKAEA